MKNFVKILCLIYLTGSVICAQNMYVNNLIGNDANDGLSPIVSPPANGPKKSISNAITAATAGSIIYVAATGINYIESPNVNKLVTFIGYSVAGTAASVVIDLSGGDMIFNIPSSGTIFFMALPIGGVGYSYPAAAGFQFRGTSTTGFNFTAGFVVQVNVNFSVISPFRYSR